LAIFVSFNAYSQQANCLDPGDYSINAETLGGDGTSANPYIVCGNNDALMVTSQGVADGTGGFEAPALVFAIYTQQPSTTDPSGAGATGVILSGDDGVVFDSGTAFFSNTSLDYGTYVIVPVIVPDSTSNVLIPDADCSSINLSENYDVFTFINPGENPEACCAGDGPSNDLCENAMPLQVGEQGPFNNTCASASGEACDDWFGQSGEPSVENSLWYSIAGNGFDITIASLECNDFGIGDTQFALYEDGCDGTLIACEEDNGPGDLYTTVTFASQVGVTYYLLVDGWDGATGDYCLNVISDAPDCTDSDLAVEANMECMVDVTGENTGFAMLQVNPSGGDGNYTVNVNPEIIDLFDGEFYDYTITIVDGDGCTVSLDVEGQVFCPYCPEPSTPEFNGFVCEGETITLAPPPGLTGETIEAGVGFYILEFFDENGCLAEILEATISAAAQPFLQPIITPSFCEDNPPALVDFTPFEMTGTPGTGTWYIGTDNTGIQVPDVALLNSGESYYYEYVSTVAGNCSDGVGFTPEVLFSPVVSVLEQCVVDENGENTGEYTICLEILSPNEVIVDGFPETLCVSLFDGEVYNFEITITDAVTLCTSTLLLQDEVDCPPANPCIGSDLDAEVLMVCQTDENGQNTGFAMLEVTPMGGAGDYNVEIFPEPELLANGDFYGYTVLITDADGCELAVNIEGLVFCPECDDDVPILAVDAVVCTGELLEFAPPVGCIGETVFLPPGGYELEYFDENGCLCMIVSLGIAELVAEIELIEQVCLKDSLGFNTGFGTVVLTIVDLFGEEITDIEGLPDAIPHGEAYDIDFVATSSSCTYELNVSGFMDCPPDACENSDLEINAFFGCDIDAQGNLLGTATLFVEATGGFGEVELIGATSGDQLDNGIQYGYEIVAIDELGCTAELLFEGIIECEPTVNCDFTVTIETTPSCVEEVGYTGSAEVNIVPEGDYIITWSDGINSGNSANGLAPGEYEVTVSSVSGVTEEIIYNADFDANGGDWELNIPTGANDDGSNIWTINDAENGENVGDCGDAFGGDNTLHVTCTSGILCGSGALYNAAVTSNIQANSPSFDISGYSNVTMTFDYIGYGESGEDFPTLLYSTDDGASWQPFADNNPPTQSLCCDFLTGGIVDCSEGLIVQGVWTESVEYAVPDGTTNIAINWTNNADNEGVDPSFAIDNILITGEQAGEDCTETLTFTIENDQPVLSELFIPVVCIDNPFVDLDAFAPETLNGVSGSGTWYEGTDNTGEVISGIFEVKDGDLLYYEFTSNAASCTDGAGIEIKVNQLPELDLELVCAEDELGNNTGVAILFYEVTVDSDAFTLEGLPPLGTTFNDGDEYNFEVFIQDADGCSETFNISGVIECPVGECEIELGDMPQDEIILCSIGEASAQISSVSLPDNAEGFYAIHTLGGEDAPGEILDTSDDGVFNFSGLENGNYYQNYYLSYVAISPECGTVVSQGPSVIWLAPVEVLVTQDCEESANFYSFDMIFNFTGGLPELDPENYFYTVAGNINGSEYAFGETYSTTTADLEPYFVEIEDDLGCSSEASGVFDPCSKTAIELGYFRAESNNNNNNNHIEWMTYSENENDYFELKRSFNGYDFEPIARINGAGTTSTTNTYSYIDADVRETAFYQLYSVDFYGNITISEVVLVERAENAFEIISIEASTKLNIQLISAYNGQVLYEIYNVNGQLAKAGNFGVHSGQNQITIEEFEPHSGVYFVKLMMGNQAASRTIFIAR